VNLGRLELCTHGDGDAHVHQDCQQTMWGSLGQMKDELPLQVATQVGPELRKLDGAVDSRSPGILSGDAPSASDCLH
jgi:hypothetical protein